jgi:predicted nucleic acid-binding Zn finger protein
MTVPDKQRVTPHMARKGRRLVAQGKVRFVPTGRVYVVAGDHDTYIVTVAGELAACSCAANGTCSHIQAVRIARRHGTEPAHVLPVTTPTST